MSSRQVERPARLPRAAPLGAAPAAAQIQPVDPDTAIDGDLMGGNTAPPAAPAPSPPSAPAPADAQVSASPGVGSEPIVGNGTPVDPGAPAATASPETYRKDDLIGAAGTVNFLPPTAIRADQTIFRGTRLPYAKFPRNPSL